MRQRRQQPSGRAESVLRFAERTDLLDDLQMQQLLTAATLTENTHLVRQIERVLVTKSIQHYRQPFDENPLLIHLFQDRLALGTTITG